MALWDAFRMPSSQDSSTLISVLRKQRMNKHRRRNLHIAGSAKAPTRAQLDGHWWMTTTHRQSPSLQDTPKGASSHLDFIYGNSRRNIFSCWIFIFTFWKKIWEISLPSCRMCRLTWRERCKPVGKAWKHTFFLLAPTSTNTISFTRNK